MSDTYPGRPRASLSSPDLCAGVWSAAQLRTPYRHQLLSKCCLSGVSAVAISCWWSSISGLLTALGLVLAYSSRASVVGNSVSMFSMVRTLLTLMGCSAIGRQSLSRYQKQVAFLWDGWASGAQTYQFRPDHLFSLYPYSAVRRHRPSDRGVCGLANFPNFYAILYFLY